MSRKLDFWASIDISSSGCWEWQGYVNRSGYGQFRGKYAHRGSYEMFRGPIPQGLEIDHLCRNRKCVNPAHLEAVTQKENQLRGFSVSGNNARKTHCLNGHPLVSANVSSWTTDRRCKTCLRAHQRAYFARNRDKINERRRMK
jgi:hypothetical protein